MSNKNNKTESKDILTKEESQLGGINPQKPPVNNKVLTLTLLHTKALFLGASKFFEAHASLEDAVISEISKNLPNAPAITIAGKLMSELVDVLHNAISQVDNNIELFRSEGSWQLAYFNKQRESIQKLHSLAQDISQLLKKETVIKHMEEKHLQESLWHENANSEIRVKSIEFINGLIKTLQHHIQVVEETNK